MNKPRVLIASLALMGASLLPTAATAQDGPLQPQETQMYFADTQYACIGDPSTWRAATPVHDSLVEQGYSIKVTIAAHPGFAPFSDQFYFLCRAIITDAG